MPTDERLSKARLAEDAARFELQRAGQELCDIMRRGISPITGDDRRERERAVFGAYHMQLDTAQQQFAEAKMAYMQAIDTSKAIEAELGD